MEPGTEQMFNKYYLIDESLPMPDAVLSISVTDEGNSWQHTQNGYPFYCRQCPGEEMEA